MIQFSWPELLLFLFSALVCGAVVYNFLSVGTSSEKIEAESTEEDFISAEEKQRLRNYDLDENLPKLSGKNNDLIKQLENRIEKLEEQLRFPVNQELQNRETKDESLYSDDYEKISSSEDIYESGEDDDYLQAREEMELALFKAKRQLTRFQKMLQEQKNLPNAEADNNQAETRLINELTQRAQVIEQLNLSFQNNPHTVFSLKQMKQRLQEQTEALSVAESELQQA
ncbi:MAG: hypothetical protein ACK50E_03715 [Bacteroidota bacterium]|jgi:hypothetical protein